MSQNLEAIPGFTSMGAFPGWIWPSSINQAFDPSSQYSPGFDNAVGLPSVQAVSAPYLPSSITESQWVNSQQSYQNHHCSNETK
jgi:hypothetical protein